MILIKVLIFKKKVSVYVMAFNYAKELAAKHPKMCVQYGIFNSLIFSYQMFSIYVRHDERFVLALIMKILRPNLGIAMLLLGIDDSITLVYLQLNLFCYYG